MYRHFIVSLCGDKALQQIDYSEALAQKTICVRFLPCNGIKGPAWRQQNVLMEIPNENVCDSDFWRKVFVDAERGTAVTRDQLQLGKIQIDMIVDSETKDAYRVLNAISDSRKYLNVGIYLHAIFLADRMIANPENEKAFFISMVNDIKAKYKFAEELARRRQSIERQRDIELAKMDAETLDTEKEELFKKFSEKRQKAEQEIKDQYSYCPWNRLSLIMDVSSEGEQGDHIKALRMEALPYILAMPECDDEEEHRCVAYSCNKLSYILDDISKVPFALCRNTVRSWNSKGGAPQRLWKIGCNIDDLAVSDTMRMMNLQERMKNGIEQFCPTGEDLLTFDDNYVMRSGAELLKAFLEDNPHLDIVKINNCDDRELSQLIPVKSFLKDWVNQIGARMIVDPNIDAVIAFFENDGEWDRWINSNLFRKEQNTAFDDDLPGAFGSNVSYEKRLRNAEKICRDYSYALGEAIAAARLRVLRQYTPIICNMAKKIKETRDKALEQWYSDKQLDSATLEKITAVVGTWYSNIERTLSDFTQSNVGHEQPQIYDLDAYAGWLTAALDAAIARIRKEQENEIEYAYKQIAEQDQILRREIDSSPMICMVPRCFDVEQGLNETYILDKRLNVNQFGGHATIPSIPGQPFMMKIAAGKINNMKEINADQAFIEWVPIGNSERTWEKKTLGDAQIMPEDENVDAIPAKDIIDIQWTMGRDHANIVFSDEEHSVEDITISVSKEDYLRNKAICTVPPKTKLLAKRIRVTTFFNDGSSFSQRIVPQPIQLRYSYEEGSIGTWKKLTKGYRDVIITNIHVYVNDIDDVFLPNEVMIKTSPDKCYGYRLSENEFTEGVRSYDVSIITRSEYGSPCVILEPAKGRERKYTITLE